MNSPSERHTQSNILIVGAGVAGLTLALTLAKAGVRATVVEKQETIEPSKWTILLYPTTMKLFDELGVLEAVSELGLSLKGPEVDTKDEVLAVFDASLISEPRLNHWLLVGPSEIRKILLDRAVSEGVEVLEGVKFKEVIRDGTGRISGARLERNGEEFSVASKVLVGADGYNSKVRTAFGCRTKAASYPVEVAFFLDQQHGLERMKMILGNGAQMVVLPNSMTRLNIGYTERGLDESTLSNGEAFANLKQRMFDLAPFLRFSANQVRGLDQKDMLIIEPKAIHVEPWVVDGGVLIGDAAHCFHPGTGMGAQQAFADAFALASVLVACSNKGDFGMGPLMEFEKKRRPFMNVLESTNKRNISMQLARGRMGVSMRNRFFRAGNKLMQRKEFQEIIVGGRGPSIFETLRLALAALL